ncbi:hypothetical protein [Nitratireductor soli]|uniref:hypothetical protein n=1 Tax=Nitratireductor soli TaxID=1670619 RepID=UPI000A9A1F93|nr:hypothetical protein [Nitratireductor soli]
MAAANTSNTGKPFASSGCGGTLSNRQVVVLALVAFKAILPSMSSPRGKTRREKSPEKARMRGIATVPGWLPAR